MHGRCGQRRAPPEQRVLEQVPAFRVDDVHEHTDVGRHDELAVAACRRGADAERFTTAHEHDLIHIAHHLVRPDVPDEEPGVRETNLEVRAETFGALCGCSGCAAHVFDNTHVKVEECRARRDRFRRHTSSLYLRDATGYRNLSAAAQTSR